MLGLSLAPATGQIIADLLSGDSPEALIAMFRPDRFLGAVQK